MTIEDEQVFRKETRSHPRFQVRKDILMYNETTFAEIVDISEAGLSCRYLINLRDMEPEAISIDLLNGSDKLHVRNIHCKTIHCLNEIISPSFPSIILRTCGIKFAPLNEAKRKEIKNFIGMSKSSPAQAKDPDRLTQ